MTGKSHTISTSPPLQKPPVVRHLSRSHDFNGHLPTPTVPSSLPSPPQAPRPHPALRGGSNTNNNRHTFKKMATVATQPPAPPATTSASSAPRDFVFIDDSNPNDTKSKAKRRAVRAQAARGPHTNTVVNGEQKAQPKHGEPTLTRHQQLKRQRKGNATTTIPLSVVGLSDFLNSAPKQIVLVTDKPSRRGDPPKEEVKVDVQEQGVVVHIEEKESDDEENRPAATQGETFVDQAQPQHAQAEVPAQAGEASSTAVPQPELADAEEAGPSSLGSTLSIPRSRGTAFAAPFIPLSDLGASKPYIPMLINHYLSVVAVAIPELDAGIPFLLKKRWFPLVMTSPATMYVTLLTAASHYCALNSLLQTPSIQSVLLDLKQACLESINREMRSHPAGSAMPDTVVGAVAKMASYEAMFGTGVGYHTHMRGLTSIITQRGGLGRLGLGGLLMRMVLWIDINSAFILGGKTYFEATAPLAGHVGFMQPNPMNFLSIFGRGEGEAAGLTSPEEAGDVGIGERVQEREQQYRDWLDQTGQVHAVLEEEDDQEVKRGEVWTTCGGNIKVPRQDNVAASAAAVAATEPAAAGPSRAPAAFAAEPVPAASAMAEGITSMEGLGATNPMSVQDVEIQQQSALQQQQERDFQPQQQRQNGFQHQEQNGPQQQQQPQLGFQQLQDAALAPESVVVAAAPLPPPMPLPLQQQVLQQYEPQPQPQYQYQQPHDQIQQQQQQMYQPQPPPQQYQQSIPQEYQPPPQIYHLYTQPELQPQQQQQYQPIPEQQQQQQQVYHISPPQYEQLPPQPDYPAYPPQ